MVDDQDGRRVLANRGFYLHILGIQVKHSSFFISQMVSIRQGLASERLRINDRRKQTRDWISTSRDGASEDQPDLAAGKLVLFARRAQVLRFLICRGGPRWHDRRCPDCSRRSHRDYCVSPMPRKILCCQSKLYTSITFFVLSSTQKQYPPLP